MSYLINLDKITKPTPIRDPKKTSIKNTNKINHLKISSSQILINNFEKLITENKIINKVQIFTNFLKQFSKEEKINYILLDKLSKEDLNQFESLLKLNLKKEKYFQTNFLLKKIFKKLHKDILYEKYHKKNLFYIRKIFCVINKKILSDFVLKNGSSKFNNLDFENFLNFYFDDPNENLKILLKYGLKNFRKTSSIIIFSYDRFKKKFFKCLYFLNEKKWKEFEEFIFDDLKNKKKFISECILSDYSIQYFENLFS